MSLLLLCFLVGTNLQEGFIVMLDLPNGVRFGVVCCRGSVELPLALLSLLDLVVELDGLPKFDS